jgi:hypothetical protein
VNDAAFIPAIVMIRVCDVVEEFLACGMYPLSNGFGFGFREVCDGKTSMSKVVMPLPKFPVARIEGEDDSQFTANVELDAKKIVGSYGPKEHDACIDCLCATPSAWY